jgi:large subunit ribosomal protein L25
MADMLILRAEPRTVLGKKVKQLRREGLIPGVVYGPVLDEAVSVSVNRRDFEKFYAQVGHSTFFTIEWAGDQLPVVIREVQIDPVKRNPLHIDFFAPNMRQRLQAMVPVVLHHHSDDAKGVLNQVTTEIQVEGLPSNLPHQIDADISGLLEVGDTLHAASLTMPEGVTLLADPETVIANIAREAAEEAAEAAAPEEVVEEAEAAAETGAAAESDEA